MTITKRIERLQQLIRATNCQANIVAVSKGQPLAAIAEAFSAGITQFGENYWQEASLKITALRHLPITWHFIGRLQSNKAAAVAQHFDWVHSVDRLKIAQMLSKNRAAMSVPLNICVQVNLANNKNQGGISEVEALELIQAITPLPAIRLRGLMTILPTQLEEDTQYYYFKRLQTLLIQCNRNFSLYLDTLSMGMSQDFIQALYAGSTMLRIGRAIFGERQL